MKFSLLVNEIISTFSQHRCGIYEKLRFALPYFHENLKKEVTTKRNYFVQYFSHIIMLKKQRPFKGFV